jgi:hypothetical protein
MDTINLRETGQYDGVRNVLRMERRKLKYAKMDDFEMVSKEFETNIIELIDEQSAKEKEITEDIQRRTRNTLISFGITLTLGAASLAFPAIIPLTIGGAIFSIAVGSASIKDLINQHLTGEKEIAGVTRRPISFLLNSYRNADDLLKERWHT